MSNHYPHLTSPLYIRGKYLKSRFSYPVAQVHFLQGPEKYPGDPVVSFYSGIARNGSALVMTQALTNSDQREMFGHDTKHFASYDLYDKGCQNYFTQLTHFVHCEGSLIGIELSNDLRLNYSVNDPAQSEDAGGPPPFGDGPPDEELMGFIEAVMSGGPEGESPGNGGSPGMPYPRTIFFTPENMQAYIDQLCERALLYKSLGFDAGLLDMSDEFYIGEFLYPHTNHRTDEFGGSFENRMKFAVMVAKGLRERVGDDFIIMANSPGANGHFRGPMQGLTLEESVKFCKALEPYVDIMRLRDDEGEPRDFCRSEVVAKQLRDAGVKMHIAIATPYMDLDKLDSIIAEGGADIISSGRMFICNEHLGDILSSGDTSDFNPCIDCGVCRGTSATGDWMSHCTINPVLGQAHRLGEMTRPVGKHKKIAIVGGGPGGMYAAVELKKRGHTPVIFEKSDALGGQIKTSRYPEFKWRLERYLDALIARVQHNEVEVRLNTEATPEMIAAEGFDAVVVAVGASPKLPNIEGAETARWNPINIYGHAGEIGEKVVVVGGSSTASEAGMYLAEQGHKVTIISRKSLICHDLNPIRARSAYNKEAIALGVKVIRSAKTTKIEPGCVSYTDKNGEDKTILCDDVIVAGGMTPNCEETLKFYGCCNEMYVIGDCREAGSMRTAIRDAHAIAIRI